MSNEDKYFAELQREQAAKIKAEMDSAAAKKARAELQALHFHKCGKCGADMSTVAFRGVEIEVCGECNAVLLDPGELEKLAGKDPSGIFAGIQGLFGR